MKRPKAIPNVVGQLLCLIGLLCSTGWAQLPVLLQVDVSNPLAMAFAATGNKPALTDSSASTSSGVTLMDFFIADAGVGNILLVPGTLTAAGGPPAYDFAWNSDFSTGSGNETHVELYTSGPSGPQLFTTTAAAFSGSAVGDYSSFAAFLPSPGASGDIRVGDGSGGSGNILGRWTAVPEPSTIAWSLMTPLGLVFVLWRRRRLTPQSA